eukprot:1157066-Pelagomonas_calceolata.AAC.1
MKKLCYPNLRDMSEEKNLVSTTPGVGQDKQQARRWPIGVWLDLPAFVHLSCNENPTSTRGPHNNPKSLAIIPAGFSHTRCCSLGLSR